MPPFSDSSFGSGTTLTGTISAPVQAVHTVDPLLECTPDELITLERELLLVESRGLLGLRVLNESVDGWRDLIDWEVLDIADPKACMLFQIYGSFELSPFSTDERIDMLFQAPFDVDSTIPTNRPYYRAATSFWIKQRVA